MATSRGPPTISCFNGLRHATGRCDSRLLCVCSSIYRLTSSVHCILHSEVRRVTLTPRRRTQVACRDGRLSLCTSWPASFGGTSIHRSGGNGGVCGPPGSVETPAFAPKSSTLPLRGRNLLVMSSPCPAVSPHATRRDVVAVVHVTMSAPIPREPCRDGPASSAPQGTSSRGHQRAPCRRRPLAVGRSIARGRRGRGHRRTTRDETAAFICPCHAKRAEAHGPCNRRPHPSL